MPLLSHIIIPPESGHAAAANKATIANIQDANSPKWVSRFPSGVNKRLTYSMFLPSWYVQDSSSQKLTLHWRSPNASTGNVFWIGKYASYANNSSLGSNGSENIWTTLAVPTSGLNIITENIYLGNMSPATPPKIVFFKLERGGSSGSVDTLSDNAELLSMYYSMVIDTLSAKASVWIPASAFIAPTGSTAAGSLVSTIVNGSGVSDGTDHYSYLMNNLDTVDSRFTLPSNYVGNLAVSSVYKSVSNATNYYRIHGGKSSIGSNYIVSLTASASFSKSDSNLYIDSDRSFPVSVAAGDEITIRFEKLAGTTQSNFFGCFVSWSISPRTPQIIRFFPQSLAQISSSSNYADIVIFTDSSGVSRTVTRFASGLTKELYYKATCPATFGSELTVKLRWKANSSTTTHQFRLSLATPGSGQNSDPVFTNTATFNAISAGQDLENETSILDFFNISLKNKEVYLKVEKLSGGEVDILEILTQFRPNDEGI